MGLDLPLALRTAGSALRNPRRLAKLRNRTWRRKLWYRLTPPRRGSLGDQGALRTRAYDSYDDYLRHQQSKLHLLTLDDYDASFHAGLRNRLGKIDLEWRGETVLCLAARVGSEVKAFLDLGAFAVGADLNPGKGNPYVLVGDFHQLVFADASVGVVYTNSLDHAYSLPEVLAEIGRVLKPAGCLIVDAMKGVEEEGHFGEWEATAWATSEELVAVLVSYGFSLDHRSPISVPWTGDQLVFTRRAEPSGPGTP